MDSLLLSGLKGKVLLDQLLSKGRPKKNAWNILFDWSIPKIFMEIVRIREDLDLGENYTEIKRWSEKIFVKTLKAQLEEIERATPLIRNKIVPDFEVKFLDACFTEIQEKMTPHEQNFYVIFYRKNNKFPDWFNIEDIQNNIKAFFLTKKQRLRYKLSEEELDNLIQESWLVFLKNCKKREFVLTVKITTYLIAVAKKILLIQGIEENNIGSSTKKNKKKINLDLSKYIPFSEFVKKCSLCFEKYSSRKENFCLRTLFMHYNKVSIIEIGRIMNWNEESTKKRINECLESFLREIKNEKR